MSKNNNFELLFTENAKEDLETLESDPSQARKFKVVAKCLYFMQANLKHPSLNTHEYHDRKGPRGEKIFESYAQNSTPGAYRVFWFYGPEKSQITIIEICPHP